VEPFVRIALLLAVLLPVLAHPAYGGALHRWTDDQGRVHMTDDPKSIPARYRSSVSTREYTRPPAAPAPRSPSGRRSKPATGHYSAPIKESGGHIWVQVTLNGQVQVPFVLDTGAALNLLPRSVAEELRIPLGPDVRKVSVSGVNGIEKLAPLVELDSVEVGGAVLNDMPFSVSETLESGLIGMPFLRHFRIEIQPAEGVMKLEKVDLSRVPGILYGGQPESYWRDAFQSLREELRRMEKTRKRLLRRSAQRKRAEEAEQALREQYERLETLAIASGVPPAWRE
jgi:clan AA aspartic protease (TIGR02281 family)